MNRITTVEELKALVSPMNVYEDYLRLSQRGRRRSALCPFHKEKTASFFVDTESGLFYCFGCHKGGDIIKFIEEIEKCSFEEAVSILARKAGVEFSRDKSPRATAEGKQRERIIQILSLSLKYYKDSLSNAGEKSLVKKYISERQISKEAVSELSLGYSGERGKLFSLLLKEGFRKDECASAGVLQEGRQGEYYEYFRERLVFPIFDLQGRTVGFGGRTLIGEEPKYLNTRETAVFRKRELLYGLNFTKEEIRKEDKVILVEGYMDFLSLFSRGVKNCAASLGTSLTPNQASLLKRYTNNVVLVYDFDTAGKSAMERALPILLAQGLDVKVALIPEGKDPDEAIKAIGAEEYRKRIENSLTFLEFIFYQYSKGNFFSLEEKLRFLEAVAGNIAEIKDPIKREAYLNELSDRTGVKKSLITEKIEKMGTIHSVEKELLNEEEFEIPEDEQFIIKALLSAKNDYLKKVLSMPKQILQSLKTSTLVMKLVEGVEISDERELKTLAFVNNSCHEINGI
ncbi:MAG: DNA primase, partial [Acidobacteriota bacterium]